MLYSIINLEELENLNDLVSLQIQVREVRSQDRLGKQNFQEKTKNYLNQLRIQLKKPLKT